MEATFENSKRKFLRAKVISHDARAFLLPSYATRTRPHKTESANFFMRTPLSQPVRRTAHAHVAFVGHLGANHRGVQIRVTEQLLHRANRVAIFEQTRIMLLLCVTMPFKPLALSGGILYPARAKKNRTEPDAAFKP